MSSEFPLLKSKIEHSENQPGIEDPPSTLFDETSFSHVSKSEIKEDYWNFGCKSSTKDFDLQFLDELSKMYAPQNPKPQNSLLNESCIASELDSNAFPRANQVTENHSDSLVENYNFRKH